MYEQPEIDPRDWLAGISDPEERARFAREFGLTDRWHRSTPSMCAGGGGHASINACVTGVRGSRRLAPKKWGNGNA